MATAKWPPNGPTGKERVNTLLLLIPLLALTDRQNYRETDRVTERKINPGWAG